MVPSRIWLIFFSTLIALLYKPTRSNNEFLETSAADQPARILLLTAHPDDECMFFAPTILSLTKQARSASKSTSIQKKLDPESGLVSPVELFSLCLSIGDADGLGEIRKHELGRSLDVLGVDSNKRWVLDHPNLKDNITTPWNPDIIASAVKPYVLKYGIDTVLTFDYEGISSHPNHKSLPLGMKHLIAKSQKPPRLFTLITLPVMSKYTGILAPTLAKFDLFAQGAFHHLEHRIIRVLRLFGTDVDLAPAGVAQSMPVFVAGCQEYLQALKAMFAHKSQLVWFRWLYVLFSRYMWVNEWVEWKPEDD
ncbi:LmbE-like protein [Crucibulum laeve]|uniref:N-acetylglucosaminylphosphatidylinositol deacetylase n=1 Tax=Crucibulum laeve TaxID=68775 RepID=A0A5C3LI45_9AGAR|nr:LmbE-like protein [Crucibulum laeve]